MQKNVKLQENVLICPKCDNDHSYLHQTSANVIFRGEDKDGVSVLSSDDGINIKQVPDEDIKGRRDSISITFACENCNKKSDLSIIQHKGVTIIEWEN